MSGKKNLECMCPEPVQRAHSLQIGEIKMNADFDWARAAEAEAWMRDFLAEGRGLNGSDFTESEVTAAFKKLKQGVHGIDGLSRKYVFPLLDVLIPYVTALLSYVISRSWRSHLTDYNGNWQEEGYSSRMSDSQTGKDDASTIAH